MSVLQRLIINHPVGSRAQHNEPGLGVNPHALGTVTPNAWNRVFAVLNRRMSLMEANIEAATDEWADVQGLDRAAWDLRMRAYASALKELHCLSDELLASRNEIP